MLGLFWEKTTTKAAISGAFLSIPIALYFKVGSKGWSSSSLFVDLPFMHQMGITFVLTSIIMIAISHFQNNGEDDPKGITFGSKLFKTDSTYNILSFAIILMLVALYAIFW